MSCIKIGFVLAVAIVLLFARDAAFGAIEFHLAAQPSYRIEGIPNSLTHADIDGDGDEDLIVANSFTNTVSVLLGQGDGSFAEEVSYAVGTHPHTIAVADFTGDGVPDLAVANAGGDPDLPPGDLAVLPGNGGGSFRSEIRSPTTVQPVYIVAADFNSDGAVDLVSASLTRGIAVFLGRGNGTFEAGTVYAMFVNASSVVVVDLNGDAVPDLAVADFGGGRVILLRGFGDGRFEVIATHAMPGQVYDLTAGDFDGNGRTDLVGLISLSKLVVPMLAQEDGSFVASSGVPIGEVGITIVSADFDDDGALDLVTVNAEASGISVLRGRGDGSFEAEARSSVGLGLSFGTVADLNGDGHPDLALSDFGQLVWILLNAFGNQAPVADAGEDRDLECVSATGAEVVLDGTRSSDPDSTAGTHDDIARFEWFEGFGEQEQRSLGTGEILTTQLSLGEHRITLRVVDNAGAGAIDQVIIRVADTQAPTGYVTLSPDLLWPPNHALISIQALVEASDICGGVSIALDSIVSDEPDDAPGRWDGNTVDDIQGEDPGTPDTTFLLRAERSSRGDGRTYTVTYRIADSSGNATIALSHVVVPLSQLSE